MKVAYVFRNDFRIYENELLDLALNSASEICLIVKREGKDWGNWRKKFYTESIFELKNNLEKISLFLNILNEDELKEFDFRKFDKVVTPLISTSYEKKEVKGWNLDGDLISRFNDRLLKDFPLRDFPKTFTDFRKIVEPQMSIPEVSCIKKNLPVSIKISSSPSSSSFFCPEKPIVHDKSEFPFLGGEIEGKKRLEYYFYESQKILTYKETRNGLMGLDYSSRFSPYLALGCLSPWEIFRQVKKFENEVKANESTYWVKFEILWREFFRWVYEKHGTDFFKITGIRSLKKNYIKDPGLFLKWKEGKTGVPFVDANMRELKHTGWMSNRGRQIVASFLVNDLKLPWTWGAQYFEQELIDYDVFSNWGNWQYIAGVGNDPRPNRYFNISKQQMLYDPKGEYTQKWLSC